MVKRAMIAAVLLATVMWAPPVVHAAGSLCAAKAAVNPNLYYSCVINAQANCHSNMDGLNQQHVQCIYGDGGRDECENHVAPFGIGEGTEICDYVPPGG